MRPMSAKELARMQAVIAQSPDVVLFPDTPRATLRGVVSTPDGVGGTTQTVTIIATNVRCLVRMWSTTNTSDQETYSGQPLEVEPRQIILDAGTPIDLSYTIQIGSEVFEVTAINAPVTYMRHVRVSAKKVS